MMFDDYQTDLYFSDFFEEFFIVSFFEQIHNAGATGASKSLGIGNHCRYLRWAGAG